MSFKNSDFDSWKNFKTWNFVLPPSRPDKWQLDIIRSTLKKKQKNANVAILGSTIEFRDLLAEEGFSNVYIFEKNKNYYDNSLAFRIYRNKENVIWGDWSNTLKEYFNYFDIILSDLTSGNIFYKKRYHFYMYISTALKKRGFFIDRVLTKPISFLDIDMLIKKYKQLPINLKTANEFNCEILFCSSLLGNSDQIVNTTKFYDYLINLNNPIISKFVEVCYLITPRDCIWWYSIDWNEEKKIYTKYFERIKKYDEPVHSSYFQRCKLFINKKGL